MIFHIKVKQFRKIEDPFDRGFIPGTNKLNEKVKYVGIWHIDDTPSGIPMSTNPREQKLTSGVAKNIDSSLNSRDKNFHLKNRGLVLSAKQVSFNNKTSIMTLTMDNDFEHGNVDGGHTYQIALNNKNKGLDQYIPFEVMVNVEDIIEDLAESRNTSTQVDVKSLAELSKKFKPIQDYLKKEDFYKRITFKQNQKAENPIDAREVVAILTMFDIDRYTPNNHPVQSYSSKAQILKYYLNQAGPEHYRKFSNIAPDIFALFDTIEQRFPVAYNNSSGRYGAKSFSGYQIDKKGKQKSYLTKFGGQTVFYKVPYGLIYPLLAAFRSNVRFDESTQKFEWKKNPIDLFEMLKSDLVCTVMDELEATGNNPNALGKHKNIWGMLYMKVASNIN